MPGTYDFATSAQLTGTVTLDAGGISGAVFVIRAGSTLTTASNSVVNLINGAQSCNVYWQVGSSATLGTTTSFAGTILANTSITANTGDVVDGRLLAANGAVTLDTDLITRPSCASPAPTTTALTASPTSVATGATTTLTATVTGTSPTGTVEFFDGATSLGTAPVTGGTATLTVSTLPAGDHSVTAVYSGDGANATSTSAPVTVTVGGPELAATGVDPGAIGLGGLAGVLLLAAGAVALGIGRRRTTR